MSRRRSKLERARARFARGEHWAAVPCEILASDAYAALPDYAARVLIAVAAGYRGSNNGSLSLTQAQASTLGIAQAWKVQAALPLLTMTGLLERTREGKYQHGKPICALFALTWKPINPTPQAYPPIEHERPASNAWAKWTRPPSWTQLEQEERQRAQGKAGRQRDFSSINPGGLGPINPGVSAPVPTDQPGCIGIEQRREPTPINPGCGLLDSPRGVRSAGLVSLARPSAQASDGEARRRVEKLHSMQPHLQASDLAKITRTTIELAKSVIEARP